MNFEFTDFEIYIGIRNFNLWYSCQICTRTDVGIEVSANEMRCLCSLPAVGAHRFTSRLPWPPTMLLVSDYPSRPIPLVLPSVSQSARCTVWLLSCQRSRWLIRPHSHFTETLKHAHTTAAFNKQCRSLTVIRSFDRVNGVTASRWQDAAVAANALPNKEQLIHPDYPRCATTAAKSALTMA